MKQLSLTCDYHFEDRQQLSSKSEANNGNSSAVMKDDL